MSESHGIAPVSGNVLGILSMIIWSLISLISVKYVSLVLRADNDGEGGILALLALGFPRQARSGVAHSRTSTTMLILGLLGASLLYGDGIITPAISVLSAVEGLKEISPALEHWVVPITLGVLFGLFSIQHRGTGKVGVIFGPVTLIWFLTIGCLGVRGILLEPSVLGAFNPWHALRFLIEHKLHAGLVLGSVFLVVTGGEALYADMGHFGRRPIQLAWFWLVLPALLLNYLGQGALTIHDPSAAVSPFHRLAPSWFSLPLVILGAMATVIASQALISGAFSLTMQAVQLGFLPRMAIQHTSESEHGQIYIRTVNKALMIGCLTLVIVFRNSSNLAAAYGIAVSLTMGITTVLFYFIIRRRWQWRATRANVLCSLFIMVELVFIIANCAKIMDGGWFPLVIGGALLFTMLTWKRGRNVLAKKFATASLPIADLVGSLAAGHGPRRVRGTAVFLAASSEFTPQALLHNLKHNQVLHAKVIILTILSERVPRVHADQRIEVQDFGQGIWRVTARYGFMEQPDIPGLLRSREIADIHIDPLQTSFFLGRETLIPTNKNFPFWQASYFALLSRGSQSAMAFFNLPPNRVIELGTQIEI